MQEPLRRPKENSSSLQNKGGVSSDSKNYGAKARVRMTSADKKDKVMQYEKENNVLKSKGTLLENEITKMKTKLHRIEELMRSRSKFGDTEDYDVSDMQRDLRNECDEIKTQNDEIKEKVRKLNVIQRSLAAPTTAGAKTNKYAHVQGKLQMTAPSKMSKKYQQEASDMRAQLQINNRKVMQLENELQVAHEQTGGMGMTGADAIRNEISTMNTEIRQQETEMEKLKGDFVKNESIFKQGKNYQQDMQAQIRDANSENEQLKQKNFRLHLRTQEVTDLEHELNMIVDERDQIERSIRNVTAEPFLRKNEGQSIQSRLADMETRLKTKEKDARAAKKKEQELTDELTTKKEALLQMKGVMSVLQGEHQKAREDLRENNANKGPTEQDAMQGLIKTDPGAYTSMMTDLVMGHAPGPEPIWAKLPFLERATSEQEKGQDPKQRLLSDIAKIKHEASEFGYELEKAQSLLKLQTDIERENTVYFNQEIKRLSLVERSSKVKVEELARRADEKSKSINDLQRKVDTTIRSRPASPERRSIEQLEVMSEFSTKTYESEIRHDENILDFKVEDGEYYLDAFNQVPGIASQEEDLRSLVTVVTLDFYNHSTETTQMAEGTKANYQSQFSFVNTVDNFYVTFLQKNSLKMDVYLSRNNAAVHLGRCEVLLKELIESEVSGQDMNMKTPVIQNWAQIFPVAFSANDKSGSQVQQARPLGMIKFKMRLRKPIAEAMRFYRETNEINNMTKNISINPQYGSIRPVKKLITITVVGCKDLQVKYSTVANVAPFFFYQFYTFEDRFSHNAVGVNPSFNDTFSYEVLFDAKALNYFEKEHLEIIVFDDNAPIAGTGVGEDPNQHAGEGDDMIGSAKVPLNSLVSGCSIHEKYQVRAPGSHTLVGDIEVKIAVMDLEQVNTESMFNVTKAAQELHYNKEWEQDVVMRIARKLATLNCDIELLFGIFSQGSRNCTKEDFKHCVLNRLNLRKEGMNERELELLLMGNAYTRDSNVIEKDDFVQIFSNAIIQARNERQNEAAFETTLHRDQSFISHQTAMTSPERAMTMGYQSASASMLQVFNESEVYEILGEAIKTGAYYKIVTEAYKLKHGLYDIKSYNLKNILIREGMINEQDANKVIIMLQIDDQVNLQRFEQVLNQAKQYFIDRSKPIEKLRAAMINNGKLIVQRLEAQDINRDGAVNVDGFKAALLMREIQMTESELEEAFHLISEGEDLAYYDWVMKNYPNYKDFFQHQITSRELGRDTPQPGQISVSGTARDFLPIDGGPSSIHETSMSLIGVGPVGEEYKQRLAGARTKVENYLKSKDISLGTMFRVMDTDSSGAMEFAEFKSKVKGLHMGLDDEEVIAIFKSLDMNSSGSVTYAELVEQFSAINTEQIINRIQKLIVQSNINEEFYFNKYAGEDGTHSRMSKNEFNKMVKDLYTKVTNLELSHVFKHFDRGAKGYIRKEDFLSAFNQQVVHKGFNLSIEDIIKPLATKARQHKVNFGLLFDKYDTDKNHRLSAEELRDALAKAKLTISQDDVVILKEYFQNQFQSNEIKKEDFINMMETKFERTFAEPEAKRALFDVKNKIAQMRTTPAKLLMSWNPDKIENINIASFKMAINSLKCLGGYDIDNLTKYLDVKNEGYISIGDFQAKVDTASIMGSSFRSSKGHTNKWTTNQ